MKRPQNLPSQSMLVFIVATALLVIACGPLHAQDSTSNSPDTAAAKTTADPTIPTDELALLLRPMTHEQIKVEADGWLNLFREKVAQISQAELTLKRRNRAAAAASEQEEKQPPEEIAAGTAPDASDEQAEQAAQAQQEAQEKEKILGDIVKLREQRTALIDRLEVVLDALEVKGGDPAPYRTYITAVAGITADVDVSDVSQLWVTIRGWLTSREGGLRWGRNLIYFLLTLLIAWIVARIAANAVGRALGMARNTSDLLKDFLVSFTRRVVLIAGLLVAITMLEFSVGPVLAIVGAAGFVVAFALQGTLSNFASGIMILYYRPFDVGDAVNAGGVAGVVKSMNLVSTVIFAFDNQRVIVPNNEVWNNVITNITGLPTRRVDMTFGIGYDDDADKAMAILDELVKQHELVLEDPEPVIKLHELGDSSVNLICRPWAKTSDYWTVYWDITKQAKERFDAAGITIPFPQRDVHVYQAPAPEA